MCGILIKCLLLQECKSLDIQFHFLSGEPEQNLPTFVKNWNFGAVVTDFNPLRIPLQWIETVKKHLPSDIPFVQVCQSSLSLLLSTCMLCYHYYNAHFCNDFKPRYLFMLL